MYPLVFSIFWTVAVTVMFAFTFHERATGDIEAARLVLPVFAVCGLLAIWISYTRYRRYQSVREITSEAGVIYVWTELDGSEARSSTDPREEWDSSDSDGDGGD